MVNKLDFPKFDGTDYAFWKIKMEGYLASHGYEIEKEINNTYVALANASSRSDEIKAYEVNAKVRENLWSRW